MRTEGVRPPGDSAPPCGVKAREECCRLRVWKLTSGVRGSDWGGEKQARSDPEHGYGGRVLLRCGTFIFMVPCIGKCWSFPLAKPFNKFL